MASSSLKDLLGPLDRDSYVSFLSKLIGEGCHDQSNPPDLGPKEDRVGRHILDALLPFSTSAGGGPLIVTSHVSSSDGRRNIIAEYPGSDPTRIISFVGCHMDVVTVDPSDSDFDSFRLRVDGDKLEGRGMTDSLAHVAQIAELMRRLGQTRPVLKSSVVAIFTHPKEDSSILGVGIDTLVKHGLLNKLKNGPLFRIDTADKQPSIGTGEMIALKLRATGKLFHSGHSHKDINPLESATEALKEMQTRFYKDFATPSASKPTQFGFPGDRIDHKIPGVWTSSGDMSTTDALDDTNANTEKLDTRGSVSKDVLPFENLKGKFSIGFNEGMMSRVVRDLESRGSDIVGKICEEEVGGYAAPGSIPEEEEEAMIREMQDEGFDVQPCRYNPHALRKAAKELYGYADPYSITRGSLQVSNPPWLEDKGFAARAGSVVLWSRTFHQLDEGFRHISEIVSGKVIFEPKEGSD